MNDPQRLLREYLSSFRDPEKASSLFADDGVFEMPYLVSLGWEPRHQGRENVQGLISNVKHCSPTEPRTYRHPGGRSSPSRTRTRAGLSGRSLPSRTDWGPGLGRPRTRRRPEIGTFSGQIAKEDRHEHDRHI